MHHNLHFKNSFTLLSCLFDLHTQICALFHFTFDMAKDNLQKALDKDDDGSLAKIIHKIIPEYNDADGYDYDVIMQTAMYGELTYS